MKVAICEVVVTLVKKQSGVWKALVKSKCNFVKWDFDREIAHMGGDNSDMEDIGVAKKLVPHFVVHGQFFFLST